MTEETIETRKRFARYCWKHKNIFQKMKWRFSCKLWEEDWVKSVGIQELKKQLERAREIIREIMKYDIPTLDYEKAERFLKETSRS